MARIQEYHSDDDDDNDYKQMLRVHYNKMEHSQCLYNKQ